MTLTAPFCPNTTVDLSIRQALRRLSEADARTFCRKFREQRHDDQQFMHTFRELLAGVFVARQGFEPHYEPELDGLTPDWRFDAAGNPVFIADVVNFHIDRPIEVKLDRAMRESRAWCDWMPDNARRLCPSIQGKAAKYKDLVSRRALPFVVFIYSYFSACVQPREVETCLNGDDGLFDTYPTLAGVCHFEGAMDSYNFVYLANPRARHPGLVLEGGFLPVPLEAAA
jgi:hypothetical protein